MPEIGHHERVPAWVALPLSMRGSIQRSEIVPEQQTRMRISWLSSRVVYSAACLAEVVSAAVHRSAVRQHTSFGSCPDRVSNVVSRRRRLFRCEAATAVPAAGGWKFPRIQTSGSASVAVYSRHRVNASEGLHRLHASGRSIWELRMSVRRELWRTRIITA